MKIVKKPEAVLKVVGWSPSRVGKYNECPAKVKYEDVLKMCPVCFKGRVSGGFDGGPVVCDTCSEPQPEREALDRGNMLDKALTDALTKKKIPAKVVYNMTVPEERQPLQTALRHPAIEKLAKKLAKTPGVSAQESIVLDKNWNRVSQFTKGAWGRLKLDVLWLKAKVAKVIDWKSGNIDKSKGIIRERAEYADSMFSYQVAVMSVYPKIETVEATMAFIDAPPKLAEPFKSLPVLKRADLPEAQKKWEGKVERLLSDTIFAPRPGMYCNWCPFAKKKGGPCPHGV